MVLTSTMVDILELDGSSSSVKVGELLQPGDSNVKLAKNDTERYYTVGLSLAPHKLSGAGNVCGFASPGCIGGCLHYSGLASVFPRIPRARVAKTVAFFKQRAWFLNRLGEELENKSVTATRRGLTVAGRLNVLSDIGWERFGIIDAFPQIQFYDYTKNPRRAGLIRPNYWLTFSRSETNEATALELLNQGCNVAVVFADPRRPYVGNLSSLQRLPNTWQGFKVLDGEQHDMRFHDRRARAGKPGFVIGLRLKSASIRRRTTAINSGFAVTW